MCSEMASRSGLQAAAVVSPWSAGRPRQCIDRQGSAHHQSRRLAQCGTAPSCHCLSVVMSCPPRLRAGSLALPRSVLVGSGLAQPGAVVCVVVGWVSCPCVVSVVTSGPQLWVDVWFYCPGCNCVQRCWHCVETSSGCHFGMVVLCCHGAGIRDAFWLGGMRF